MINSDNLKIKSKVAFNLLVTNFIPLKVHHYKSENVNHSYRHSQLNEASSKVSNSPKIIYQM